MRELAARLRVPATTVGDYVTARHLPSPSQLHVFTALLRACGVPETELGDWVAALGRMRTSSDRRTRRAASPYPGLASFQEEDAASYFGRDAAVRFVLDRLSARLDEAADGAAAANPVLAVVGASGSGKSSLLRAGLIPAVRAQGLPPRQEPWTVALMTPASDPVAGLHGHLHAAPRLLVVDQFEELFTACTDAQRRQFLDELAGLDPRATAVVLGLRADFYSDAVREPSLVPALQRGQVVVPPMTETELRAAIVEPARRLGVSVDGQLVDLLLREVGAGRGATADGHGGSLPLLSYALLATWAGARGNRLTVEGYLATGGIDGAVQQSAEDAYLELDPTGQELARQLFLRLVNLDDALITRRRVERAELEALGDTQDPDAVGMGEVIDRFVEHRLLTVDLDGVEVSHEALLTAWARLRDWIAADRDGLRVLRQLTRAANIWEEHRRDDSTLLRGTRLEAMRELSADPRRAAQLNAVERDFVAASIEAARREQQAARRRARRLQRLLAVVAVLALVATGLAVYATRSSVAARDQRAAADRARGQALSREVAIESRQLRDTDPALATQLALAAYRISPTTDARSVLIDASSYKPVTRVLGPPGPTALAQRPDGQVVAVSRADDGSVQLYRMGGMEPPRTVGVVPGATTDEAKQLFALCFSPDGRTLATGGEGKVVHLWDVSDPSAPRAISTLAPAFGAAVQRLSFSPDGNSLVAVGSGPAALRWDVSDRAHPRLLGALPGAGELSAAQAVAFAPAGKVLAVGGAGGRVLVWTNPSARPAAVLAAGTGMITTLAFSPDGRQLAAGSKDGNLHLWDVTDPGRPRPQTAPATGFTTWLNVLAYSPDGRTLAAGSSDRNVKVWDTRTWTAVGTMPHPAPITGLAFSADGGRIMSTDANGSFHMWPTATRALPVDGSVFALGFTRAGLLDVTTTGRHGAATLWKTSDRPVRVGAVAPSGADRVPGASALSLDGRLLASGTRGGPVLLWNVSTPGAPRRIGTELPGASALVESLALTPDAGLLAAGADDNAVHLWDVRDPLHPRTLPKLATGSLVLGVAFSPDGTLLAAAVADNTARLYDVRDPAKPRLVATLTGFRSYAWAVAFSPDGKILAVSSADHTTRLWDVSHPEQPRQLGGPITGPHGYATGVSFAPDGDTLAVSGEDQTVWLYDVRDPAHPSELAALRALTGSVYAVAFAPQGHALAAAGGDTVVRLWDTDPQDVERGICRTAGDTITRQEWADYVPGAKYDPPCG